MINKFIELCFEYLREVEYWLQVGDIANAKNRLARLRSALEKIQKLNGGDET